MAGKNKNSSATPISGGKAKGINTKARSSSANRSPNGNAALPVLNPDKLRELYSIMLKCRMLNDKLQVLLPATGLHEPIAMIGGREAMLVGAIAHLVPED